MKKYQTDSTTVLDDLQDVLKEYDEIIRKTETYANY